MDSKQPKNHEQSHFKGDFHAPDYTTPAVLMIGSDREIFDDKSAVRDRVFSYAEQFSELHIIVLTSKKHGLREERKQISKNIWLYPTDSRTRFLYSLDAERIGKNILKGRNESWVVTAQDPFESGIAGLRIARHCSAKLHVQLHTDPWNEQFLSSHKILNTIRIFIARHVLPNADCVRVVSRRISDSLKKHVKLRSEPVVLPVFVDVSRFSSEVAKSDLKRMYPQFENIVLWIGRLEKEKNASEAIRIVSNVIRNYPKTGLVIVGEGREKEKLQRLSSALDVGESVVFEGWQRDTLSRYKSADVLLVTSMYEGYGMTIVEALASGCPVVSTDVGVAKEVGATVVKQEELAVAIEKHITRELPEGKLLQYPYKNEAEYTHAVIDQWKRCALQ